MGKGIWTVAALAAAMTAAGLATAAPTTRPMGGGGATTRPMAHRKMTKPWSELTSLTPQQQDKIVRIHEDATEQEKQLRAKEHDDIAALLTPEQQTELATLEDKTKVDRKEKYTTGHKKKGDATTQPAK